MMDMIYANIVFSDYKKLTFYFYAEQYINFNDLVTELFKIWKLRIWLSAVNPASYPEQKTRSRGHRLRAEAALAASSSPSVSDGPEGGYPYQVYSPASNAAMMHNPYTNVNHSGYGGPFSNPNAYMQNQATSFGNNFPANAENSMMNTYFSGSTGTPGLPNQQHWGGFGGHPSNDYGSTGPNSASNAGQSLAGFAGATPFVPGRGPGFGVSGHDGSRNFSSKGRQVSIGSMSTLADESAGKFEGIFIEHKPDSI
jgi:PSP1 C-terminal conserved region